MDMRLVALSSPAELSWKFENWCQFLWPGRSEVHCGKACGLEDKEICDSFPLLSRCHLRCRLEMSCKGACHAGCQHSSETCWSLGRLHLGECTTRCTCLLSLSLLLLSLEQTCDMCHCFDTLFFVLHWIQRGNWRDNWLWSCFANELVGSGVKKEKSRHKKRVSCFAIHHIVSVFEVTDLNIFFLLFLKKVLDVSQFLSEYYFL